MDQPPTLLERHREILDGALHAIATREYYSAYPESPSPRVYGETAAAEGQVAFEGWLGSTFLVSTPGAEGTVSTEKSPFGLPLDVAYPRVTEAGVPALLEAPPESSGPALPATTPVSASLSSATVAAPDWPSSSIPIEMKTAVTTAMP